MMNFQNSSFIIHHLSLMTDNSMNMSEETRWYSLRVISGKERAIKERIDKEIKAEQWENYIPSVVVPTEKMYKIRNGKKVITERNILPGYILVEAMPSKLRGNTNC
jgi:transcription termination/antitermination protein NusG